MPQRAAFYPAGAAALALCLAACGGEAAPEASAAAAGEGASITAFAEAGQWRVRKSQSYVRFKGVQNGEGFTGDFGDFDAAIVFDPNDLENASIRARIGLASATTGDRQRDDALKGADWFAAKDYPAAEFASDDIKATGEGIYEAQGALTIRDVSRDIALPFVLSIEGDRAEATAEITLVRSDFGVGRGEFAGGKWVDLEVGVEIGIIAIRAGS